MDAPKVIMVKTGDLKPAPFNPAARTDDRALRTLYASMREKGFLPHHPITIVDGRVIADGHRRWTCAKMLNIPEVPCIVAKESLHEVWAENGSQRPVSGAEVLRALADGLQVVPDGHEARIEKAREIVGDSGLRLLADKGLSTRSLDVAKKVAKYCGKPGDKGFTRQAFDWLVYFKLSEDVKFYMRREIPASVLVEKITAMEELKIA